MAGAGDFDRRLILVSGLAVAIAAAAGFLAAGIREARRSRRTT